MNCNTDISLPSLKIVFWKESSRGGNTEELPKTIKLTRKPFFFLHWKELSHCGRDLLKEAGLIVCGSSSVADLLLLLPVT